MPRKQQGHAEQPDAHGVLFLDSTTDLEGSVTFTESPPPLPATPGADSKSSHLDTENSLTAQAQNNTVYFHFFFFLQSSAETTMCDATASGAGPTAMRRSRCKSDLTVISHLWLLQEVISDILLRPPWIQQPTVRISVSKQPELCCILSPD